MRPSDRSLTGDDFHRHQQGRYSDHDEGHAVDEDEFGEIHGFALRDVLPIVLIATLGALIWIRAHAVHSEYLEDQLPLVKERMMDALAPSTGVHDDSCPSVCARCEARPFSICHVLPHPELRRLFDSGVVKTYAPHAELVREGDLAEHVFNITGGTVMLYRLLSDGRRQVLGFLLKGDFLGVTAGSTYDLSVEALTPVQVCRFPRPAFRRLLLETPPLEEELLARASDELLAARAHLTLLGRKTAMERVASFLLHLAERQLKLGGSAELIELPMMRTDIADHLGLTAETVSRSLSILKRFKTIELIDNRAVRLLKPAMLADLAEAD